MSGRSAFRAVLNPDGRAKSWWKRPWKHLSRRERRSVVSSPELSRDYRQWLVEQATRGTEALKAFFGEPTIIASSATSRFQGGLPFVRSSDNG